ncbi:T9SS type A sorting domain-containing protein [Flavobacteriales bacterium]|nr:T9SS type A sorting domain-containing protein [Flavobacteriales bacterium]
MKKLILVLVLLAFSFNTVKASHLMGGEITWECIKSGNKKGAYVFSVKVYRDCQGVAISTSMSLNAHNVPGISTIPLSYIGANDISPSCNSVNGPNTQFSCGGNNTGQAGSGNGAVEEHTYRSDTIEISGIPDANGWHFTWSSCCRNLAITNLTNAALNNTGFTLRAVMYSYIDSLGQVLPSNNECYDSSPKFFEKPRTILEVGNGYDPLASSNGFTYSHNAFDEEQDSISYTWGQPLDDLGYDYLNPNSTALSFSAPYSYLNPINAILMNSQTGRTWYPANQQGNFVTCTKVSAFKCGQLVSEVFREIQVVLIPPTCNLGDTTSGNVGANTLCNVRPSVQPPFFYPSMPAPYQWDTLVHCGDTVKFDFNANDNDVYPNGSQQDLLFEVSGGQFYDYLNNIPCQNPPCATFNEIGTGATPPFITSGGSGSGEFEWITSCNHVVNTCGSDLQPTVYTFVIKVSDDFCPAPAIENTSQVISITVYPPCGSNLKANASVLPESYCGVGDGSISVNPNGGFPPYTSYYFDMNGLPVNPNALSSGDYQIRITDVSLCEIIDTITVPGPVPVSVNSNQTICNGDSIIVGGNIYFISGAYADTLTTINGCDSIINTSLIVNMSSSSSVSFITCDTSYLWNGLVYTTSGVYTSTYTNTLGCDSIHNLNLTINNSSITINNQNLCFGSSYIMNGNTYSSSGIYVDTLTNTSGCDSIVTTNLNIGTDMNIMSNISQVSCNGYSDGSINITISGGNSPYSYLWSDGSVISTINNLYAGVYSVAVTDTDNCSSIDSITIIEPILLAPTLVSSSSTLIGNSNGGTIPYIFEFWGPNGFVASSSNNLGTSFSINPLISGIYTFIVVDANGCTDSSSIIYSANFTPLVTVSLSNNWCDSLADLSIQVSQDSGEVDMSTALFESNGGSFDIASMSVGDTIGTSSIIAGGGSININAYLIVSVIVSNSEIIIQNTSVVNGNLGSFTITNLPLGGISIFTQTIPDGNNYTSGNMNSVTFNNVFINPCFSSVFTSTITSELGDIDLQNFNFIISENNEIFSNFNIYPNPVLSTLNIQLDKNSSDFSVIIYDISGKVIFSEYNFSKLNNATIDVSHLSSGMYLISVSFQGKINSRTFYKK